MNESADQLFHFTKRYDSIVDILINRFKPFFCVEDFSFMYSGKRNLVIAYPIVSFCDIPIERHIEHKDNYGEYGIGLTKDWGKRNNLNIVNYSFNESQRSSALRILVEFYIKQSQKTDVSLIQEFKNAFNILLMTSKPYEGRRYLKNSKSWTEEKIRFYNEREWRYLPLVDRMDWSVTLENENYETLYNEIEKIQPKIQAQFRLTFSVNDIVYIFLREKSETDRFLSDIAQAYSESELSIIEKKIVYS